MASEQSERKENTGPADSSRREFVQKAAYIAPVLLTLPASPSLAGTGSERDTSPGGGQTPPGDGGTTPKGGAGYWRYRFWRKFWWFFTG